ncbi:MAG: polymorphic toxin type 15 domain-containing protein [Bacteroidia bacterium]
MKVVLPIEGEDQQQGAQAVKDAPAMGAAAEAAMILGSKGRSAIRNPDDVVDGIGDWAKDKKNPRMPTKPIKMNQYEPPCFQPGPDARKNYQGSDKDFEKEYHKQLKMQQDGINNMTVGEYLDNRRILQELTDQHGSEKAREILTQGGKAQIEERKRLKQKIRLSVVESMKKRGVDAIEAEKLAEAQVRKQMDQLAALHNPDLIAGGKDEIGRMGNKGVNSSIGAQWPKQGRVTGMDDAAKAALEQYGPKAQMNVKLERCR